MKQFHSTFYEFIVTHSSQTMSTVMNKNWSKAKVTENEYNNNSNYEQEKRRKKNALTTNYFYTQRNVALRCAHSIDAVWAVYTGNSTCGMNTHTIKTTIVWLVFVSSCSFRCGCYCYCCLFLLCCCSFVRFVLLLFRLLVVIFSNYLCSSSESWASVCS